MQRTWRLAIGMISLGVWLGGSPSWGEPPNPTPSDAARNTAGGSGALEENSDGSGNTAFGYEALGHNTTGFRNTANGDSALYSNTTGYENTASGVQALRNNTEGWNNTASGTGALRSNTEGNSNTASGYHALESNTTGDGNAASGRNALRYNTTGRANTASGAFALRYNTTASHNIAIGSCAGCLLSNGDHNIYLGHEGVPSESDTLRLGQAQTRTFIAGVTGVPVSGSAVLITAQGQLGIQASAARYKTDIAPMGTRSQGLFQLRPVTFRYRQDPPGARQYGLIAEEVAAVYPELVTRDAQGAVESVRYQEVIPLLLNELQHQHQQQQLATQGQEVTRQAQQLAVLAAQNAALVARLAQVEAAVVRAASLAGR